MSQNTGNLGSASQAQQATSTPRLLLGAGTYGKAGIITALTADGWSDPMTKFHSLAVELASGDHFTCEVAGTGANIKYRGTESFGGSDISILEEMDDFELIVPVDTEVIIRPVLF